MGIQLAHVHQQCYGLLTGHYELFLNGGQSELQPFEKNVAKSIICLSPFLSIGSPSAFAFRSCQQYSIKTDEE